MIGFLPTNKEEHIHIAPPMNGGIVPPYLQNPANHKDATYEGALPGPRIPEKMPLHLVYDAWAPRWVLEDGHDREPLSFFYTEKEAMSGAVALAKRSASLLLVYDKQDKVAQRIDYR